MKRVQSLFLGFLLTSLAWAQISKDQLYEMTEKGLDESVIVSLVEKNCVDFELDGQMVVELSTRVTAEVLRTVIDCVRAQEKKAEPAVEEAPAKAALAPVAEAVQKTVTETTQVMQKPAENGVPLPTFLSVEVASNKASFTITDLEFRMVAPEDHELFAHPIRFEFSGKAKAGETVRSYRPAGKIELAPGEYIAYLHVVSTRKKGIRSKEIVRSDLHKFRVEFTGPGPIKIEYTSTEGKTFKSAKAPVIEAHGPMSFHGEQHVSVGDRKNLENLTSLFGDAGQK